MISKLDMLFSANFGVIVILFLLPFVTVSCGGQIMNIPLTGVDLAFGKDLEMKKPDFLDPPKQLRSSRVSIGNSVERSHIPPSPLAIAALGLAVFGMAIAFMSYLPARIMAALSGLAGGVLLLILKMKMDDEAIREGGGLLVLSYGIPFWLALILLLGTAAGCAYSAIQMYQRKRYRADMDPWD